MLLPTSQMWFGGPWELDGRIRFLGRQFSPISHKCRPWMEGVGNNPRRREKKHIVINHLLNGMILQVY